MTFMSVEDEPCHPLDDLVKEALLSYKPGMSATVSVSPLPSPDIGWRIPEADTGLLVIGIGTAGTRIIAVSYTHLTLPTNREV